MRNGYWKTLLRTMRQKVSAGENVLRHADASFIVKAICADEDVCLDNGGEVRLAEDEWGNWLAADLDAASVALVDGATGAREQWGGDLTALVQALQAGDRFAWELGPVVADRDVLPQCRRRLDCDD